MDYLVRAALADAERYRAETDPGTRIFIRQLVEMHAANLRLESQNMRLVGDVCEALEAIVDGSADSPRMREICHERCKERNAPGNRPARRR